MMPPEPPMVKPVAPAVTVRFSGGFCGSSAAAPPPLEMVGKVTFTLPKFTFITTEASRKMMMLVMMSR